MLHVLCLYKARAQQSTFPAGASHGSFFPAGASNGPSFPTGASQGSSFPAGASNISSFCHGNQTKWPLVIKHNWAEYHQMIITAKYGSHHFKCY